jgi:D-glycero-alpha-D-manno-heptose 1-phosphate guanylyltransferase
MFLLILVGGLGTRLGSNSAKPKPLTIVAGKSFLRILTDYFFKHGIVKIYLACGHGWQAIELEFYQEILAQKIICITEPNALGTGGAILHASKAIFTRHPDLQNLIVCNGDSFVAIKPQDLLEFHTSNSSHFSLVATNCNNDGSYGIVTLQGSRLASFQEKAPPKTTEEIIQINTGLYAFNSKLLQDLILIFNPLNFTSLEYTIIPQLFKLKQYTLCGMLADNLNPPFIDIGTPQTLSIAQKTFKTLRP